MVLTCPQQNPLGNAQGACASGAKVTFQSKGLGAYASEARGAPARCARALPAFLATPGNAHGHSEKLLASGVMAENKNALRHRTACAHLLLVKFSDQSLFVGGHLLLVTLVCNLQESNLLLFECLGATSWPQRLGQEQQPHAPHWAQHCYIDQRAEDTQSLP